jgi:hypothetical protein
LRIIQKSAKICPRELPILPRELGVKWGVLGIKLEREKLDFDLSKLYPLQKLNLARLPYNDGIF